MYNRLNKIINKIKSLGRTRWGRREVIDKITPADVIGRIEEHLITVKESKFSQEMSKMHE
jgi:hypothetical protein